MDIILIYVSVRSRQRLINAVQALARLLPVLVVEKECKVREIENRRNVNAWIGIILPMIFECDVNVAADSVATERRVRRSHEAMTVVVRRLKACEMDRFDINKRKMVEWKCVQT